MPGVDERLRTDLDRAARPADPRGVFDDLVERRRHRAVARRVGSGALAVAVLAATTGGFVALRAAFDETGRVAVDPPLRATNGRIVFSRDIENQGETGVHLFTMGPHGSGPRQLTSGYSRNSAPAVSPDGLTIAFSHELYDADDFVVATIPIDGGAPTWLTDPELQASNPTWSPDGTRIAFTGMDGDTQRIFVMSADGSDPQPITGDDVYLPEDPAWSPGGARIAFRGSPTPPLAPEGPSDWDIYTIEPDGEHMTNLTRSPAFESQPSWSPDGQRIVYVSSGEPPVGSDLVVRHLADGVDTPLTEGPELDSGPIWSPDGRFIVFDRQPVVNGPFDLWRVRPDGSELTELTQNGAYGAAWQPLLPGSSLSPLPDREPTPTATAEPDIGLPFPGCAIDGWDGDFNGDGRSDRAYLAVRVQAERCPASDVIQHAGLDLDRDGRVDSSIGPLPCEPRCEIFATPDLNRDGRDELLLIEGHVVSPVSAWIGVYGFDGSRIVPMRFPDRSNRFVLESSGSSRMAGAYCSSFGDGRAFTIWQALTPDAGRTYELTERTFVIDVEASTFTLADERSSRESWDTLPPTGIDGRMCGALTQYIG